MNSSYTKKDIQLTIALRQGTFAGGEDNAVTIKDLPISAEITKGGGDEKNKAIVTVRNLKLDTVERLTMLAFQRLETYKNVIQIKAGNKGAELDLVFSGEIASSVPAISDNGELSLKIEAMAAYYANLIPTAPTSVNGAQSIESLMKTFADEAQYAFENRNVSGSVSNCVFVGSPVAKARALARQTGIDLLIDDGKFIIQTFDAPKDGEYPLLSASTGLLGYPSFSNEGITCRSIFNNRLEVGKYFKLESLLPRASGDWQITKLTHRLEANIPDGGAWITEVTGVLPGSDTNGK